jgi:hypothetical protein
MKTSIGYNRTVKLAWLEAVAGLAGNGKNEKEIYSALSEMLKDQLSKNSEAKRGSREKTITLLIKTWVRVPKNLEDFRQRALKLFRAHPTSDHIILHWAMTFVTYPFCKTVAEVIGRSLKLQGSVTAAQVQRRVREMLGERETVSRSTRYVIRAMQDWGVFSTKGRQGIYKPVPLIPVENLDLARLLCEALLRSNKNEPILVKALESNPALFPFDLARINLRQVLADARFEVSRHGINEDMVRLGV